MSDIHPLITTSIHDSQRIRAIRNRLMLNREAMCNKLHTAAVGSCDWAAWSRLRRWSYRGGSVCATRDSVRSRVEQKLCLKAGDHRS